MKNRLFFAFAGFVFVVNCVALTAIAQKPAPPVAFSLNDGQDNYCQDYEVTDRAHRTDIAQTLRDMAQDVEDYGCANLSFIETEGR